MNVASRENSEAAVSLLCLEVTMAHMEVIARTHCGYEYTVTVQAKMT